MYFHFVDVLQIYFMEIRQFFNMYELGFFLFKTDFVYKSYLIFLHNIHVFYIQEVKQEIVVVRLTE